MKQLNGASVCDRNVEVEDNDLRQEGRGERQELIRRAKDTARPVDMASQHPYRQKKKSHLTIDR